MSAKTDADYLRDMLEYAERTVSLLQGRTRAEWDARPELQYSAQYCLLIVGEAANHVSPSMQKRLPEIPWPKVVGMRNYLVHAYGQVNLDIVWDTATRNLPGLIEAILRILPPEQA